MSTFCTFCGTYSYNQEYLVCHLEFIFRMIEWELTTSLYSFFFPVLCFDCPLSPFSQWRHVLACSCSVIKYLNVCVEWLRGARNSLISHLLVQLDRRYFQT